MQVGDMNRVQQIARQHSEAVSYLPDESLRHYIGLGGCAVVESERQIIGFIVGTFSLRTAPALAAIYQLAIERPQQRKGAGTAVLKSWTREACRLEARAIMCHVAEDLPSLKWWLKQEYDCYGTAPGGRRRDRRVYCLTNELIANAFNDPWSRPPRHRPGGRFQVQNILDNYQTGADVDNSQPTQTTYYQGDA